MNLINKKTLEVISEFEFRSRHSESIFPSTITHSMIDFTDYLIVAVQKAPQVEPWQTATLGEPYIKDGKAHADYVVNDIDIERIKEIKKSEVTAAKNLAEVSGVEYQGYKFDTDEKSQLKIMAVVTSIGVPPNGYWTSADNQDVPVTAEFMQGLYGAMLTRFSDIHHAQRQHKEAIELLKAHAEVWNYEYSI